MKHNEIEIIPLSDSALTRIEEDMTKMFGVPEDRRVNGKDRRSWDSRTRRDADGFDGAFGRRIVPKKLSTVIQLATFLSYAVHAGNLEDAKTLAKAYDDELDRVLGRSDAQEIWRG